jgi:hypothetical protein
MNARTDRLQVPIHLTHRQIGVLADLIAVALKSHAADEAGLNQTDRLACRAALNKLWRARRELGIWPRGVGKSA